MGKRAAPLLRRQREEHEMTAQAHPAITQTQDTVLGRGLAASRGWIATVVAHLGSSLRRLQRRAAPGLAAGPVGPSAIYPRCGGDYHAGLNAHYAGEWLTTLLGR